MAMCQKVDITHNARVHTQSVKYLGSLTAFCQSCTKQRNWIELSINNATTFVFLRKIKENLEYRLPTNNYKVLIKRAMKYILYLHVRIIMLLFILLIQQQLLPMKDPSIKKYFMVRKFLASCKEPKPSWYQMFYLDYTIKW